MQAETKAYIVEIFKRRSLVTITQEVSVAFQKGYLFSSRSQYFNKHAANLSLAQFIKEYKKVWEVHNNFSLKLLELVPRLVKLPFRDRCKALLPLLAQALENDARVMGFTQCLNEARPENRFKALRKEIEGVLGQAEVDVNLVDVFFSPQFDTFEVELLREILGFLSSLDLKFRKELCSSYKKVDIKRLKRHRDFVKLETLAEKWTYGNIEQLLLRLRSYCKIPFSVLEEIEKRKRKSRSIFRKQKEVVIQKLKIKDGKKIQQFEEIINTVQSLLYMDHYFEPKSRFNMKGGFGDYLLRDLTARTLFEQGYLDSPNPMEINQWKMYQILREVVNRIHKERKP